MTVLDFKRLQNTSIFDSQSLTFAGLPVPQHIQVKGPNHTSISLESATTFTVPANCLYMEVLLVGAGGHGGTETYTLSSLSWAGGGGGAGAWCRAIVPNTAFTAGATQFTLYAGKGADSSPLQDNSEGAPSGLRYTTTSTIVVEAQGGQSPPSTQFSGDGGLGGVIYDPNNYVEYGSTGERGLKGEMWGTLVLTNDVKPGDGAISPFGNAGRALYRKAVQNFPGQDAKGYGAGGSGTVLDMSLSVSGAVEYGGAGARGYASIIFH